MCLYYLLSSYGLHSQSVSITCLVFPLKLPSISQDPLTTVIAWFSRASPAPVLCLPLVVLFQLGGVCDRQRWAAQIFLQ